MNPIIKLAVLILFVALQFTSYFVNAYKLTQCDFESNYKCEVIHGLGLIPSPISIVTVWVGTDEQ